MITHAELESSFVKTSGFLKTLIIGAAATLALTACTTATGEKDDAKEGRLNVVVTTCLLSTSRCV